MSKGLRSRSLVVTPRGNFEIRKLNNYRGPVYAEVNGEVKICMVEGADAWRRTNQTTFFKVVTASTPASNAGSYEGPDFAADHPILTQMGLVPISEIEPGFHHMITEDPRANPEQLSLISGSLLGDGGFYEQHGGKDRRTQCNRCGLWFSQSAPRLAYATWKHNSLRNLVPGSNLGITLAQGKKNETWRYALNATRYFNHLRLTLPRRTAAEHGHRRLVITDELFDRLGPIGLAVWYMDDGSLGAAGQATLTASRLAPYEIEVCERRWSEFLGVDVHYNAKSKNIYFSRVAFEAFREEAASYIHPSVAYKMPGAGEVAYEIDQSFGGLYAEKIIKIVEIKRIVRDGSNTRFTLHVPESGNFLTLAGFVGC